MDAVFVFSTQGAQWPGMGRRLYANDRVFRHSLDACEDEIEKQQAWSLSDELVKDDAAYRLHDDPMYILPALTAIQIGLCAYLAASRLQPVAVIGLSMGEVAAAHVAGVLSLPDALRIVCCQARLTAQPLRPGRMVVVRLPAADAHAIARTVQDVTVAIELSPGLSVLSGYAPAVDDTVRLLAAQEVECIPVNICSAFHSSEVRPLENEFKASLGDIRPRPGSVPIYSSVSGAAETGADFNTDYWWRIMSGPAFFSRAVTAVIRAGHKLFVEVGPSTLAAPIHETAHLLGEEVTTLAAISRNGSEEVMLQPA